MGEKKKRPNEDAQYIAERRTVQVLQTLKNETDENHSISQTELLEIIKKSGDATTYNAATLSKTVDEIILQINPRRYEGNENEFHIAYKGYQTENLVEKKKRIQEKRDRESKKKKRLKEANRLEEYVEPEIEKAPSITDLQFIHDFTNIELNQLMDAVNVSSRLSIEEKRNLMEKLQRTASKYYTSPFYDKKKKEVKFFKNGVYSRLDSREKISKMSENTQIQLLVRNVNLIQEAINKNAKITYYFNHYDVDKKLKHTTSYKQRITPYHIIVYHDLYYLIGAWDNEKEASHLRIDLMSEIEILMDENGEVIEGYPLCKVELLSKEEWNPEKYAAEHLNMFYDSPKKIELKIKNDNYNTLYSWFGQHYKKIRSEGEFDIVEIIASPKGIVYWALQYADDIEILTEDVREKIMKKIKKQLIPKYCNNKDTE